MILFYNKIHFNFDSYDYSLNFTFLVNYLKVFNFLKVKDLFIFFKTHFLVKLMNFLNFSYFQLWIVLNFSFQFLLINNDCVIIKSI